jgi:hypothetical protein
MLDYPPITTIDLVELPDKLSRRLFEALRRVVPGGYREALQKR